MADIDDWIKEAKERGFNKEEIIVALSKKGYSQKEISSLMGNIKNKIITNETGEEIKFFNKIGLIFKSPIGFFEQVKDIGIKNSFLTYLYLSLFSMILYGIFVYLWSFIPLFRASYFYSNYYIFGFIVVYFVASITLSFVYSGLSHLALKFFDKKGEYYKTYNAFAYSAIPCLLIGIIPLAGFLAGIYSIVLMIFGISNYHNISKGKATFVVLFPLIILAIIAIGLIAWIFFSLSGMSW